MAVTKDMVITLAAEFAALPDDEFASAIAFGEAQTNREVWGELGDEAVALMAAHRLTIAHPGARPGEYVTTRYLDERSRLIRQLGLTPLVT